MLYGHMHAHHMHVSMCMQAQACGVHAMHTRKCHHSMCMYRMLMLACAHAAYATTNKAALLLLTGVQ